jgi:AraC-like DNA-binding protein/quercetin dioxygenase-like cupin family protein
LMPFDFQSTFAVLVRFSIIYLPTGLIHGFERQARPSKTRLRALSIVCQFMSMKRQSGNARPRQQWTALRVPSGLGAPKPVIVRKQTLAARHYFPEHSHSWNQLVYATAGALTVNAEGRNFVISPDHAVWLPTGTMHRVGSLLGAEFRSLYVADSRRLKIAGCPTVFRVSQLLRALIIEAATFERGKADAYTARVTTLILDQLHRAEPVDFSLPWPSSPSIAELCDALYGDPADLRGLVQWGKKLGMSARTLSRRFEDEVGISFRTWQRKLRLFKAMEFLGGGRSVTEIALDLGYASTSAFIYMFKQEVGRSPRVYQRTRDRDGKSPEP